MSKEPSVLERAARAAELADEKFVADYPGTPEIARASPEWSRAIVSAVLQAIREPSDRMGNGLPEGYRPGSHSATQIWRAMIDTALTE